MSERVKLEPDKPVILALIDPYADSCEMYDAERQIGEYRTTDNRILSLPRPAVLKLNELAPAPGEEIGICRQGSEWRIWSTAASSEAPAAQVATESPQDTEAPPPPRRRPVPIRKEEREPLQPSLFDRGTGNLWPAPAAGNRIPDPVRSSVAAHHTDGQSSTGSRKPAPRGRPLAGFNFDRLH